MLNQYLTENYDRLKDMAFTISSGKNHKDLFSFVIEELYKCDQERLNEIISKKHLTFYIARIMINQCHSSTSRYYNQYKKYYKFHIPMMGEPNLIDEVNYIIEKKEEIETKLEWVDDKLEDCYWFDSSVFKLYYKEEHSLNSMAKATKISRATLYKSITNVKNYLKNEKK